LIRKGMSKQSHSEVILSKIQNLFQKANINFNDLDLLVVTMGPGSFTGVRVGINLINTLSFVFNKPIFSLDSLFLLALSANHQNFPVVILMNAHKNQNYVAQYSVYNQRLETLLEPRSLTHDEVEKIIQQPHLCLGDGFDFYKDDFSAALRKNLLRKKEFSDYPSCLTVFENFKTLGLDQLNNLDKNSWKTNKPLYIRASEAEEKLWKGLIKDHS
ncbi:MAG: tRNA (adenosine(37)-N6)-threonylcarbamoyltransferase complex dimerization subunit type 1 TsaB, partial [Bdellovibrionales bacterium]|nr:tRNA (adenosine(37)-N6)-threonylcarbamoyltransferase complex dimerization subunit type 1 TsaB [Bdellovibrionales bacterium]